MSPRVNSHGPVRAAAHVAIGCCHTPQSHLPGTSYSPHSWLTHTTNTGIPHMQAAGTRAQFTHPQCCVAPIRRQQAHSHLGPGEALHLGLPGGPPALQLAGTSACRPAAAGADSRQQQQAAAAAADAEKAAAPCTALSAHKLRLQ
jgi:hypothetical protein